jgi:hypothetical protein
MPRYPKDKRESLSICYQVLGEDLDMLVEFIKLTGISEEDPRVLDSVMELAKTARHKSKKLSLNVIKEEANIITADFKKKED